MTSKNEGYWLAFASALPTCGGCSERPQIGEAATEFPLGLFDRLVGRGDVVGAVSFVASFDEVWAAAIVGAHRAAMDAAGEVK